jgi:hypothetical protein
VEAKKTLNETLKQLGLLKGNTEQIVINCNAGSISDFKVTERFK